MNDSTELFPEQLTIIDESTELMLLTLAEIGTSKQIINIMLEYSPITLSLKQQRFLLGPIIQHKSAWQDTTPQRLYDAITYDRLKILFSEIKGNAKAREVGPIELVTVIYPATMDGPIHSELSSLYLRAGSYSHAFKNKQSSQEFWKIVDSDSISDQEIKHERGRYYYDYRQLCSSIRNKVVKAQKQRETKIRSGGPNLNESSTMNPDVIQGELF